jgi:DNA-binding transcriptional LysR family regulator
VIRPENHGIELRHLRYFVAVAEHGGFRRAAEHLHVSQPPLSQQIAQLEARLGAPLLVRSRRGTGLTAAGEAFLRDARLLLADLDRAVETARRAAAGRTGLVRLGFVGSAAYPIVPDIVRAFRAAHPDVEVRLRELSTSEQLDALATGSLDVGFARSPLDEPALEVEPVATEPILAALPHGHHLAAAPEVRLEDLAAEPFVMFPRAQAPAFFDHLVNRVAVAGAVPRIAQEAREMHTIVSLVAAGLGVSLVPASVSALAFADVVYRPIAGSPLTELVIVRRRGPADPAVAGFLAVARAHAPS